MFKSSSSAQAIKTGHLHILRIYRAHSALFAFCRVWKASVIDLKGPLKLGT
jgi:hypothetical protein